jgi:hypothetical protein
MQVSDDYVRQVVHAFNERGFEALVELPRFGRHIRAFGYAAA